MITVGAFEAKTKLPSLLDRVSKGEEVLITRNGKPMARLVPPVDETERKRQAIERIKEIRKGQTIAPYTIREFIKEGRR